MIIPLNNYNKVFSILLYYNYLFGLNKKKGLPYSLL